MDGTNKEAASKISEGDQVEFKKSDENKYRRYRPSAVSLTEIRQYQRAIEFEIDRPSFQRLVKEILKDMSKLEYGFQVRALEALQQASELYLIDFFTDINLRRTNGQRSRITPKDVELARKIRGDPQ